MDRELHEGRGHTKTCGQEKRLLPEKLEDEGLVEAETHDGRSFIGGAEFVAGGGVALLQAAEVLDTLKREGDEATGAAIVKVAVEAPLKQIAANAGLEGGVVVDRVRNLPTGEGLNAATGEYVNLLAAGIADPVKVTRSALQNAGSIAGLFLTTEAVVADKPEPPAAPADGGAGDMGGMY